MQYTWNLKPVLPTKTAQNEMWKERIDLLKAIEILKHGFPTQKRKKHVYERCVVKGRKVIRVVAIDRGNHYLLIHVGSFTLSKKFKKLMRKWQKE